MMISHSQALQAMGELTGREFHSLLKLWQIKINDRECRHWKTGKRSMPHVVYLAGLQVQDALESLPDDQYNELLNTLMEHKP